MSPELAVSRGRTRLLLDHPWFGSLAMRLRLTADPAIPTFCVDGTEIRYNPQFAVSLSDAELVGVLAHEVLHCALLHPYRRGSRDPREWNEAADYAINGQLITAGLHLPSGVLHDPQYRDMSAEQIYSKRRAQKAQQQQQQQQGQQGQGQPQQGQGSGARQGQDPCPTGTVEDAPAPESQGQGQGQQPSSNRPMTATDWTIAAEQAHRVARAAGRMPGGVARELKRSRESVQDWRAILRQFISETVPSDYSWTRPNRRYIGAGVYLPGTVRENIGELVIGIDTSGSIDAELLATFGAELTAILHESKPERVHVVYCDAAVNHTDEFTPDDAEIKLKPHGGGGTLFQPVFDWVAERGIQPKALIYFTDTYSADTPVEPDYPVLWCVPAWVDRPGPFGTTVVLDQ